MNTCRGCGALFTEGHDERFCELLAQCRCDRRDFAIKEGSYIDEIEKLTAEREQLQQQNQQLAAQVEVTKQVAIDAIACISRSGTKVCADPMFVMQQLQGRLEETPNQCLREIQAEAGRAGFVAGYMLCNDGIPLIKHNYQGFADKYAERVKAGEL